MPLRETRFFAGGFRTTGSVDPPRIVATPSTREDAHGRSQRNGRREHPPLLPGLSRRLSAGGTLIRQTGQLDGGEQLRRFTQTLFDRLMFLRFIQCKGWLTFRGCKDYLRALYAAGGMRASRSTAAGFARCSSKDWPSKAGSRVRPMAACHTSTATLFERSAGIDGKVRDCPTAYSRPCWAASSRAAFSTVAEFRPPNEEPAIDPEMLGTVFEELVTGRHESGPTTRHAPWSRLCAVRP